jgi:hypothetical protein
MYHFIPHFHVFLNRSRARPLSLPAISRLSQSLLHFQTPVSNQSKPRIFALKTSNPKWQLPQSEEKEALENTSLALRKHASNAREAFDNKQNVDWVIM